VLERATSTKTSHGDTQKRRLQSSIAMKATELTRVTCTCTMSQKTRSFLRTNRSQFIGANTEHHRFCVDSCNLDMRLGARKKTRFRCHRIVLPLMAKDHKERNALQVDLHEQYMCASVLCDLGLPIPWSKDICTSTQVSFNPGWERALVPVFQPGLRIWD
jgi:hypothetical protein